MILMDENMFDSTLYLTSPGSGCGFIFTSYTHFILGCNEGGC